MAGAVLVMSTMGGYSVTHSGDYIGYVHASVGDRWNTYRVKRNEQDDWLGKLGLEEAVKAIIRASGRVVADDAA